MIEIIPNWHPIFVHFTVALLSIGVLLKVASYLSRSESLKGQWRLVARWNIWIGAGFVVLTVLTGVIAYNTVAHDTPSHAAMTDHRNWALTTALVFLAIAGWLVLLVRADKERSGLFITILLLATGLLAVTAWKGGELVYRHGLGVMSLPRADNHGHVAGEPHDHGKAVESVHDHADDHHDNSDGHHDAQMLDGHHDDADHHHDDVKQPDDQRHDQSSATISTPTTQSPLETKDDHFADGHTH